jgi:hypothetical protein
VRVKPGVTVTVRNNVSRDSTVFVMADGAGARAMVEGNDVRGSKILFKALDRAVIEARGNAAAEIRGADEATGGGSIVGR